VVLTVSLTASLALGACTSMHSLHVDPSGLTDLGADEGIVFGSVRVEVTDKESGGLFGRTAEDFRYRITMLGPKEERERSFFTDQWQVFVSPGEERIFVARLPVGDLALGGARPTPMFGAEFALSGAFNVYPERPTYIGRLVLTFPARLGTFTEVELRVDDTLDDTRAEVAKVYGDLFDNARVDLIEVLGERARLSTSPRP
jgi:hypothetical protein